MKMKRIIVNLAAFLLGFALVFGGGIYGFGAEVGDKMEDIIKAHPEAVPAGMARWYDSQAGIGGLFMHMVDETGASLLNIAFRSCGEVSQEHPFGIYNFKTDTLYLDNAPNDGVVDKIIKNAKDRRIGQDAPPCKEGI